MFRATFHIGVIIIVTLLMVTPAFSSNVYYMIGNINQSQVENFHKFLQEKKGLNPKTNRILLVLNGDGGEAYSMEMIKRMMVSSPIPIDTFAKDRVASADAILFLFGKNRYDVNANLYYHQCISLSPKLPHWVIVEATNVIKYEINQETNLKSSVINYILKPTGTVTTINPITAIKLGIATSNNIPDMSIYNTK